MVSRPVPTRLTLETYTKLLLSLGLSTTVKQLSLTASTGTQFSLYSNSFARRRNQNNLKLRDLKKNTIMFGKS